MKRILPALLALLVLAAPGGASAQDVPPKPLPDANSLLPGDVIRVAIWREEDLSGEFQVDQDGSVILPLLGRRQVVGISPNRLREELTEEYADYLVNTAVNVTLLRRVVVLGEVRVPGQYTVDATQSVADLIARAQGLTPDGNAEDIRLLRQSESFRTNLSGTLSIVEAGIRSGDQIVVGKRSWLSRNFPSLVGVASIIANVVVIVFK
ncbi:MAG TPA: polysaccharide biosynthesis/export family protein [Longimicrobiales bacterium]|nr:polysaccharide biosynthesis/export family protein [Longimicrobiales bacterium]